jgi:hypothetical protein
MFQGFIKVLKSFSTGVFGWREAIKPSDLHHVIFGSLAEKSSSQGFLEQSYDDIAQNLNPVEQNMEEAAVDDEGSNQDNYDQDNNIDFHDDEDYDYLKNIKYVDSNKFEKIVKIQNSQSENIIITSTARVSIGKVFDTNKPLNQTLAYVKTFIEKNQIEQAKVKVPLGLLKQENWLSNLLKFKDHYTVLEFDVCKKGDQLYLEQATLVESMPGFLSSAKSYIIPIQEAFSQFAGNVVDLKFEYVGEQYNGVDCGRWVAKRILKNLECINSASSVEDFDDMLKVYRQAAAKEQITVQNSHNEEYKNSNDYDLDLNLDLDLNINCAGDHS